MNKKRCSIALGATVPFLFLVVVGISSSPATRHVPAGAPEYCGTKAAERLPECGWVEGQERPAPKSQQVDGCDPTDEQIKEVWLSTAEYPESARPAFAAEFLRRREKLCREFQTKAIPAGIQQLAR